MCACISIFLARADWAAIATIVIAIFTICLWWSTKKLWKSTDKAATAAKDSAEALLITEKAYVFVNIECKECVMVQYDNNAHEGLYDFGAYIMITNYGKTPATIIRIEGSISLDNVKDIIVDKTDIPKGIVLGTSERDNFKRISAGEKRIDERQRNNIATGDSIPYCYGKIKYENVFGDVYTTSFCWEYRSNAPDPPQWIISNTYKHLNDTKKHDN